MLTHAAILGLPRDGVYSQTLISGNFFVVLEIAGDPAKVTLELGRNVVSKIEEVISQTPEILPLELVSIIKEEVGEEFQLSILVAFFLGQKLILSATGNVFAKLLRKGQIVNLTSVNLNGNLLQNDLVIFGTKELFEKISFPELESKTPLEIKDSLQIESGAGLILRLNLEEAKPEIVSEEAAEIPATLPPTWGGKPKFATIFEKGFEAAPSKRTLYLVLIAFVILLSVVAFQLRSRSLEVQGQSVSKIEKSATEGIDSASKLIGLNDQLARESLVQKRGEVISEIEKSFGKDWKNLKSKEGDKLRAIVSKLDAAIARAAHINNTKLSTFYDFSLLKASPKITSAQLHEGLIIALDSANGSVYSLGTENKAGQIVGGGDFKSNSYVDFAGDNLFVYTSSGIRKKDMTTNSSFKTVGKNASSSGEIAGMASFGGNLYLLDPGNNQIWKYLGTEEGGFQPAVEYIQRGLNLDLSNMLGPQIDGFVYIFGKDRILKFASGAPEELELKSLAAPLGSIDSLYASEEAKNLYIWDGTNSRIVVVNKEGVYQAQYQVGTSGKGLGTSTIILADEKEKKIFLVSGDKVYGIDIK